MKRLPSIFKVIRIWASVHLTVEFWVNDGTVRRLIKWETFIMNPISLKQVTTFIIAFDDMSSMMIIML